MATLTKEQLQAMGLSEAEIEAILGVTNQEGGSGLPFKTIRVNYDDDLGKKGSFGYAVKKDENGYAIEYEKTFDTLKVTFLKSFYQYTKYDENTNQTTVSSNIFDNLRDAKKAVDTKSGKLISELKEFDDGIKFQRIALVKLEDTGDYAVWYIKGGYLFKLGEELQKHKNDGHLNKTFTITNGKHKKGSVTYFSPDTIEVSDRNMLETLKEDSEAITKINEWASEHTQNTSSTSASNTIEVDVDEDIDF